MFVLEHALHPDFPEAILNAVHDSCSGSCRQLELQLEVSAQGGAVLAMQLLHRRMWSELQAWQMMRCGWQTSALLQG